MEGSGGLDGKHDAADEVARRVEAARMAGGAGLDRGDDPLSVDLGKRDRLGVWPRLKRCPCGWRAVAWIRKRTRPIGLWLIFWLVEFYHMRAVVGRGVEIKKFRVIDGGEAWSNARKTEWEIWL
jgi:hypothetical protein